MLLALWMNSVSIWRSWEITVLQRVENWIVMHSYHRGGLEIYTSSNVCISSKRQSTCLIFYSPNIRRLETGSRRRDSTSIYSLSLCWNRRRRWSMGIWRRRPFSHSMHAMDEDMPSPRTTAFAHKRLPSRQSSPLSLFLQNWTLHHLRETASLIKLGATRTYSWFSSFSINSKSSNVFSHCHQHCKTVRVCISTHTLSFSFSPPFSFRFWTIS